MKKLTLFTYFLLILIFFHSINAQVIWEKLKNPAYPDSALISDFKIVKNNLWLASTLDFGLFSSSDQGESWNRIFFQDYYVSSIDVNSKNEIFIDCFYQFYKSTDEGMNWSIIPHDSIIGVPEALQLSYDDNLYGMFDALEIHYIAKLDSLYQWQVVGEFSAGLSHYVKVTEFLIDKFNDIYLSADQLSVPFYYRYTYMGQKGFNNFQLIFNDISKLACNDSGYVFIGNIWNSKLYRSSDGGLTFQELNNWNSNQGIFSIKVINSAELFVGGLTKLFHSVNNGITWHFFNGPDDINGIFSIEEISPGYLAIASKQSIYRNTSILDVENQSDHGDKPNYFSLLQNYPNPFNPSTKIKFTIPLSDNPLLGGARGGLVTLKVYDILGNEIATLVNEEKPEGEYEVEFNATELPSGIYFYKLQAGSFSETKKMILLK
jgi:hypothetical protein